MMRLLISFILSLCFLLLGGYANSHQNHPCYAQKKVFEAAFQARISTVQNDNALPSKVASSNKKKVVHRIKAVEFEEDDDDDESICFKKFLDTTYYSIALFAPQAYDTYTKGRLPFCAHFSYF